VFYKIQRGKRLGPPKIQVFLPKNTKNDCFWIFDPPPKTVKIGSYSLDTRRRISSRASKQLKSRSFGDVRRHAEFFRNNFEGGGQKNPEYWGGPFRRRWNKIFGGETGHLGWNPTEIYLNQNKGLGGPVIVISKFLNSFKMHRYVVYKPRSFGKSEKYTRSFFAFPKIQNVGFHTYTARH